MVASETSVSILPLARVSGQKAAAAWDSGGCGVYPVTFPAARAARCPQHSRFSERGTLGGGRTDSGFRVRAAGWRRSRYRLVLVFSREDAREAPPPSAGSSRYADRRHKGSRRTSFPFVR